MKYTKIALIPGDSLYPDHSALKPDQHTLFFMAEDRNLCTHFKYHKHKLILFLSSMRSHAENLKKKYKLDYFKLEDDKQHLTYLEKLESTTSKHGIQKIISYTIEDKFFREQIKDFAFKHNFDLEFVDSPGFINTIEDFGDYLSGVSNPFMHNYYIRQRKKLGILLDADGKPVNGQWSFDKENRKKLPNNIKIPEIPENQITKHSYEIIKLVDKLFKDHPGKTDNFNWATTREDALKQMEFFLHSKFESFGPYEDAIDKDGVFLFHSVLSPYLNNGLITPRELVMAAIDAGLKNDVHYPSLEGLIRQVIGWREFLRGMYNHYDMEKNFFNHKRRLTSSWYEGTTGIVPLDNVIDKVNKYAYAHHIERLMVAGNIMLLSEIHPDDVYKWFMELFIDSADWVMVPNVYGMSQFADGGIFATKPYIAGSNYILKMSNHSKGGWTDILDGLYWRFVNNKRELLSKNPRMSMMVRSFDKMSEERKKRILEAAESFLDKHTSI
jgi:deoxyribodipyrimidine photolyase-related protein